MSNEEIKKRIDENDKIIDEEHMFYYRGSARPVAGGSRGCGSEGVVFPADIYAYDDPADFI